MPILLKDFPCLIMIASNSELLLILAILCMIGACGQAAGWNKRLIVCLSRQWKIIGKHGVHCRGYRHPDESACRP